MARDRSLREGCAFSRSSLGATPATCSQKPNLSALSACVWLRATMASQNYDPVELQRGKIFAAELRPYMDAVKQIEMDDGDVEVLSYLRAISLALASERPLDFDAIYQQMLDDPTIPDQSKDLVARTTLHLQAADLQIVEVVE